MGNRAFANTLHLVCAGQCSITGISCEIAITIYECLLSLRSYPNKETTIQSVMHFFRNSRKIIISPSNITFTLCPVMSVCIMQRASRGGRDFTVQVSLIEIQPTLELRMLTILDRHRHGNDSPAWNRCGYRTLVMKEEYSITCFYLNCFRYRSLLYVCSNTTNRNT